MKIAIIIVTLIGISLFIYSCSSETNDKIGETASVDPRALIPGPIQHDDLTDSQLLRIKSIHVAFEEVYPITLNETITNFKKDLNVDKEINLWMKMEESFEFVIQTKDFENVNQRKEAFKLILMRTMLSSDEAKKRIKINKLNPDEVDFILEDFENRMIK